MSDAYTAKSGALWVFPDGPAHEGHYLGCVDAGDIVEPQGDVNLIQCFDENGEFQTVGETQSPPGAVTTDLNQLLASQRSYLEKLRGEFGLIFLERDGGRADDFNNWKRATILDRARYTSKGYNAVVSRNTPNPTTRSFNVSADNPVIKAMSITGKRLATGDIATEIIGFYGIHLLPTDNGIYPVKYGVMCCYDGAGVSNVYWTADGGHSWTVCATQPGAAGEELVGCVILDMGGGAYRLLVITDVTGKAFYSDDFGMNWVTILPTGNVADCCVTIFTLDAQHIWLSTETAGNKPGIYFSEDGGATWTLEWEDTVNLGFVRRIWVTEDGAVGFANLAYTGLAEGHLLRRDTSGVWTDICTVSAVSTNVDSVQSFDGVHVWAVNSNSKTIIYSEDGGLTWTAKWTGSGLLVPWYVQFANRWVGYASMSDTVNDYVYRTIDGGYTWERLTMPAMAAYMECIFVADENYVLIVGDVDAVPLGQAFLIEE